MPEAKPWRRVLLEGAVIVASILLAFGIEAWWSEHQEAARRDALMEDLQAELVTNAVSLEDALERQRLRARRLEILLNELTETAVGLDVDSVRALQESARVNPSWDESRGILNLLIQSGDLTLLENRELRARLAGLESRASDYLSNQRWVLEAQAEPEVLYGTGSLIMDYTRFTNTDRTLLDASPAVRERAAKFFTAALTVTYLLIPQGERLLAEFQAISTLLAQR